MAGPVVWAVLAAVLVYLLLRKKAHPALKHIPYVKYNAWLPDIFNRLLYYPKAASMIYWGYEKVRDTRLADFLLPLYIELLTICLVQGHPVSHADRRWRSRCFARKVH